MATTDAAGASLGTTLTGPFGEKVTGQTAPNNTVAGAASWASIIPGPIGMAASGVAVVAYAAAGDKKNAVIAAAGIAAAAVGAGGAVKAYQIAKKADVGRKVGTVAVKATSQISKHAAQRMAQRGVTSAMINKSIAKGIKYSDAKNPATIAHVLRGSMASGKTLFVVTNRSTGKVVTAMIRKNFNPGARWFR